jgi:hypothetical protein
MIAMSEKPIKAFCEIFINKYGYEKFRQIYIHDADTWNDALELVRKQFKSN